MTFVEGHTEGIFKCNPTRGLQVVSFLYREVSKT